MGVQLDLPLSQKKRKSLDYYLCAPASEKRDEEVSKWGAFENLTIDEAMTHLVVMSRTPINISPDSPHSSKRLISPSSDFSSPRSFSTASPPFRPGCADPFVGKSSSHRRLKKKSDDEIFNRSNSSSVSSCSCNAELRHSRWDSGRWSGRWSVEGKPNRPLANSFCKCAAGLTADLAAVCCCPLSLLHLLAIAFIKLPTALLVRALAKIKHTLKMRKRTTVHEDDDETIAASSYPPSRCGSYEGGEIHNWAPSLSFGDQRLWKDYFDSPDIGVWSSGELPRKSAKL